MKRQHEFINIEAKILMELDQLEDREKHVRSTFDNSVRISGDTNDSRQVVENMNSKGKITFHLVYKKKYIIYIEQVCSLEFFIPIINS